MTQSGPPRPRQRHRWAAGLVAPLTLAAYCQDARQLGAQETRSLPNCDAPFQQEGADLIDDPGRLIELALGAYRATGARFQSTYHLVLLAQALAARGRRDEGFAALRDAMTVTEETGERFVEAEIHRVEGNLWLGGNGSAEAETCYMRSLDVARAQGARALELRTASDLARLWAGRGDRARAADLLGPIYGWFTEGLGTTDLKEAKALKKPRRCLMSWRTDGVRGRNRSPNGRSTAAAGTGSVIPNHCYRSALKIVPNVQPALRSTRCVRPGAPRPTLTGVRTGNPALQGSAAIHETRPRCLSAESRDRGGGYSDVPFRAPGCCQAGS